MMGHGNEGGRTGHGGGGDEHGLAVTVHIGHPTEAWDHLGPTHEQSINQLIEQNLHGWQTLCNIFFLSITRFQQKEFD